MCICNIFSKCFSTSNKYNSVEGNALRSFVDIGDVLVQLLKSQPKENVLMIITSADDIELESLLVFQAAKYTTLSKKKFFGHCSHGGVINRLSAAIVTNRSVSG